MPLLRSSIPTFLRDDARHRLLAVVLLMGLAAGCANAVVLRTSNDQQIDAGILGSFRFAAGGRDFYVRILNNPYPMPDAEFHEIVTDAMQGHNNGPRTNFVSSPTETTKFGYEIVMFFGPTGGVNENTMCDQDETDAKSTGDRLYVSAVFCIPGRAMSWAVASIPHVETPADPLFARMMAKLTRGIIPRHDGEREGRRWH